MRRRLWINRAAGPPPRDARHVGSGEHAKLALPAAEERLDARKVAAVDAPVALKLGAAERGERAARGGVGLRARGAEDAAVQGQRLLLRCGGREGGEDVRVSRVAMAVPPGVAAARRRRRRRGAQGARPRRTSSPPRRRLILAPSLAGHGRACERVRAERGRPTERPRPLWSRLAWRKRLHKFAA
jgi:hypothetical protein